MEQEKTILILGAGKVTRPVVRYCLEQTVFPVIVASRTKEKAEELIAGHPRGEAIALLVDDESALDELVKRSAVVISMLPYLYHLKVAGFCLKHKKHLITTSYVKPEMKALDEEVKKAGLIFLNEIGVDPGIDHMSAMKIIAKIHRQGGKIESFNSLCGGLPAPSANDNPWGYKFSWSPRGVALAGKNSAQFLKDGKIIEVSSEKLFETLFPLNIPELGEFEVYPNRDSLSYIELYQIPEIKTMFRGTIRYPGWCRSWQALKKMNYLAENPLKTQNQSYREFTAGLLKLEAAELESQLSAYLGIPVSDDIMKRFNWLGLFSGEPIPFNEIAPIDLLVSLMESKMCYREGEPDLILLIHEFTAQYPDLSREKLTSSLISYGEIGGVTAMAKTVGTPPAIAAKLLLEGKIGSRGVIIPTIPELYLPVMDELERVGINFSERTEKIRAGESKVCLES